MDARASTPGPSMQQDELRRHFRQLRRELSPGQQADHAYQVSCHLNAWLGAGRKRRIAAYLATRGELSLDTWIGQATRQQIFLPKLYETSSPRSRFAPLTPDTRWMRNRFDIAEPHAHWGSTVGAQHLDIILLPLVAFDRRGDRMGMGGGYYDRSLAFRNARNSWLSPLLIGIAHGCQEHPRLPRNPWDVRLDMIITEQEIIRAGAC